MKKVTEINLENFLRFNLKVFLLENISEEKIIPEGNYFEFPEQKKNIIFQEKIKIYRINFKSIVSCKKIMRLSPPRDLYEALFYLCFILKYHEELLDRTVMNGIYFHENSSISSELIVLHYNSANNNEQEGWYLKRLFLLNNTPSDVVKIFI
jgi:hypothetical protein